MEKHEHCVLWKLQRGLTAVKSWCERWNVKINEEKTIYFCRKLTVSEDILQLNGWGIPFVSNVTYLGFAFDRRMTWRHHIEKTVAKALSTYIRTYSVFRYGCLSANSKLTLYKAQVRSVMTYAYPAWKYVADAHLFKLQCLQNRVLLAIGNLYMCTSVCDLHVVFKIPYMYDYITKLCRTQAEVTLNLVNPNVHGIWQGKAKHRK
jgi:hypothetical protein